MWESVGFGIYSGSVGFALRSYMKAIFKEAEPCVVCQEPMIEGEHVARLTLKDLCFCLELHPLSNELYVHNRVHYFIVSSLVFVAWDHFLRYVKDIIEMKPITNIV